MSNTFQFGDIILEIGKEYLLRYKPCEEHFKKVKFTRITQHGHAWVEGSGKQGTIYPDSYEIKEITKDNKLEYFARNWLKKNGYEAFANHTNFAKLFSEIYQDYELTNISLTKNKINN